MITTLGWLIIAVVTCIGGIACIKWARSDGKYDVNAEKALLYVTSAMLFFFVLFAIFSALKNLGL